MAESVKDEVHRAFTAYVEYARDFLRQAKFRNTPIVTDQTTVVYLDPGLRLRRLVEKAEGSDQFVKLAEVTGRAFVAANASDVESRRSECVLELQNFFRRSRFYLKAFSGEIRSPDDIFDQFWTARFHHTVKVTTLRLMHA